MPKQEKRRFKNLFSNHMETIKFENYILQNSPRVSLPDCAVKVLDGDEPGIEYYEFLIDQFEELKLSKQMRSDAARSMGQAKSPAKARAAKQNGAKGGRPTTMYYYYLDTTSGRMDNKHRIYVSDIITKAEYFRGRVPTRLEGDDEQRLKEALKILNSGDGYFKIFPYTIRGGREFLKAAAPEDRQALKAYVPKESEWDNAR